MIPERYNFIINFESDFNEILVNRFLKIGIEVPKEFQNTRKLTLNYFNVLKRLIPNTPREVFYSDVFECPSKYKQVVELIESKLKNGESVFKYLSTRIVNINFKDQLLYDWGIYHLHLGSLPYENDSRFVERTTELLFLRIDSDKVYFINVMKHGDWNKVDIMRTITRNWPGSLERYKMNDLVSVSPKFTDTNVRNMRKNKNLYIMEIDNNQVYFPPGGGLTSSGHSIEVVDITDTALDNLRIYEDILRENQKIIISLINEKIDKPLNEIELKMCLNDNNDIFILLKNTKEIIPYGNLFGV